MALPGVGGGYQYTDGNVSEVNISTQGAPSAQTTSATLSTSDLAAGLITANQGASGAATYTLPSGSNMDSTFGNMKVNSSFDFSVINISTTSGETATLAAGTGWTLVGNPTVVANTAATAQSVGAFRVRKTGDAAYTLYRIG